jgi:hypothetical protein
VFFSDGDGNPRVTAHEFLSLPAIRTLEWRDDQRAAGDAVLLMLPWSYLSLQTSRYFPSENSSFVFKKESHPPRLYTTIANQLPAVRTR